VLGDELVEEQPLSKKSAYDKIFIYKNWRGDGFAPVPGGESGASVKCAGGRTLAWSVLWLPGTLDTRVGVSTQKLHAQTIVLCAGAPHFISSTMTEGTTWTRAAATMGGRKAKGHHNITLRIRSFSQQ
jgi:hypothetical protein